MQDNGCRKKTRFYRHQELVETNGLEALINQDRRVPNLKNRVDESTEQVVVSYAIEYPAHGQHRTSNELRKRDIFVSGIGVRSIWLCHQLANFKDRLKALETKIVNEGVILNDAQIAALEKKKQDDIASGEIGTCIQATWACKTHSMWEISKVLGVVFISRPLSILTLR